MTRVILVGLSVVFGVLARSLLVYYQAPHGALVNQALQPQTTAMFSRNSSSVSGSKDDAWNATSLSIIRPELQGPADSVVAWEERKPSSPFFVEGHALPPSVVDAALGASHSRIQDLVADGGYVAPKHLDFIWPHQATTSWRNAKHMTAHFTGLRDIPVSVLVPPEPQALAQHNTGYIMVAVTSCCKSWNITGPLLQALLDMEDPVHVVLIDDNSVDGTQEKAAAMGIPVLTTGSASGLTASMKRAWQYFTSYESLQSLVLTNNDVMFASGSFTKLHECIMAMTQPSGVVGPMSNNVGLGAGKYRPQSIDERSTIQRYYNGAVPPASLLSGLPNSLGQLSAWLDKATAHANATHKLYEAEMSRARRVLYGFVMGVRKDNQIADYRSNTLLQGGVLFSQEGFLFKKWLHHGYVCPNSFAYHIKSYSILKTKQA